MSLLPDVKLAVVTGLQASPLIPDGVTVTGGVPDDLLACLPLVAVFTPPGPPPMAWMRWGRAAVNVHVWARDEDTAGSTARAVAAALHALPGSTWAGAVIQAVGDETSPGTVPDPGYPDLCRYLFTAAVTARLA